MRQIQPIREMARATRAYAAGNFDVRMQDTGRNDEIGELAASFNNMADSLAETERQRSDFIANISHELKTPMTTIAGYTDGILDGTIPRRRRKSISRSSPTRAAVSAAWCGGCWISPASSPSRT
ncbi:MAG: HAMP domain-containing protein [Dysosmobacter sp.]